jgi:signal transduction histidine kinase
MLIPSSIEINLPQHDLKVVCDALKMERVFINLIGNSIHAMNNKGTINIQMDEYENKIVIKVEDNGKGIPDEILPKIFDPLITTKSNGRGIGLAASKEIVEMHNGYIGVKSVDGLGTEFFITMPK